MKTVMAYIAPEIPALSATFVTHEILALQQRGFTILPISVLTPAVPAMDADAVRLQSETIYLYRHGMPSFLAALAAQAVRHPVRTASALRLWFTDIVHTGLFSRNAAGLTYRFLAAARLARILEKNACRHLHAHFAHVPTDIAMYAAAMAGIGFSFTSHANDLFERGWLLKEKVERSVAAVTISRFNRQFLEKLGASSDKIHIIRCGVTRHPSSEQRAANRIPRIGSLGRLVEKKGFDVLIQAAGILARQGKDFTLEIAGSGPLQDDLQALAEREKLGDRIRFMGPIANDRVPEWLSHLDIFVLACKPDKNGDMDGIPVVLMEAMAADVPVISTTISAVPELIQDGESGLLAEPGSADDLAAQIINLLDDPELRQRCIAGGRTMTAGEFSESWNIERIVHLFSNIVH
jgi:glycosyltransferase involved in cell wall biosynthesis